MTEEVETVMVECALTGEQVDVKGTVAYTVASGEERNVSVNAVLSLVQNTMLPTIISRIALNNDTYREVVAVRREAEAQQSGVTTGANKAVEAIQAAASELGVDLEAVMKKAFAPKEDEVPDQTAAS